VFECPVEHRLAGVKPSPLDRVLGTLLRDEVLDPGFCFLGKHGGGATLSEVETDRREHVAPAFDGRCRWLPLLHPHVEGVRPLSAPDAAFGKRSVYLSAL
jgi:hypothetical protein